MEALLGPGAALQPVLVDVPGTLLAAEPSSFSPGWYRQTLFDSYDEVHAFQLGVYGGALALALRARGYRHLPTGLVLALFAFAMGVPDVYALCLRSGGACGSLPVQLQPWYFLTGLLGTAIAAPRLSARLRRVTGVLRSWRTPESARAEEPAGGPASGAAVASTDGGRRRDAGAPDGSDSRAE